jgi:soluble lytic murein transglycosylase
MTPIGSAYALPTSGAVRKPVSCPSPAVAKPTPPSPPAVIEPAPAAASSAPSPDEPRQ